MLQVDRRVAAAATKAMAMSRELSAAPDEAQSLLLPARAEGAV